VFVALRALGVGWAVGLVIVENILWSAGSLVLLVGGWIERNLFGQVFIAAQALVVGVLTALEGTAWLRA
jgi:hypothetical protein